MRKPNIVFILNDHQAYYRHGWDGGVKPKTPNFDKLAAKGVEYTNAYCASPLCGPVRRSILTGLYPHSHGHYFNDSESDYKEENYLNILDEAGYDNYYYGKWHAGPGTPITELGCHGFSCEGYGNPYLTDTYKNYLEERGLETAKHLIRYNFHPKHQSKFFEKLDVGVVYSCKDDWCGEHAVGLTVTDKNSHEAFFLANLACDKLEELATSDSEEPFHMRVDFWGPHQPFFPTQEYLDMYDPKQIQMYGNFDDDLEDRPEVHKVDVNKGISENGRIIYPNPIPWADWQQILAHAYAHQSMIDDAGGRIINKIVELGLDENTIIIWATDHGDALASHGGHFDKCSYMSQEVMRIPMAMSWSNVIPEGKKNNELVSNIDIPITLLGAAGLKFNDPVHGLNLIDMETKEHYQWRSGLFCETFGHGYVERIQGRMYVTGDYKYVKFEGQKEELYNLQQDPYELNNLALREEYGPLKRKMIDHLKEEQIKFTDTGFKLD